VGGTAEMEEGGCQCFEPPMSEFVLRVWPRWCARGHNDVYWFGQNVPTSSSRLLVLLALKFIVGVTHWRERDEIPSLW
jgi:hypothetical protein